MQVQARTLYKTSLHAPCERGVPRATVAAHLDPTLSIKNKNGIGIEWDRVERKGKERKGKERQARGEMR